MTPKKNFPVAFAAPVFGVSLVAALALAACSDSVGPGSDLCRTRDGITVCAQSSQYAPGDHAVFTIINGGGETVLEDVCSVGLAGRSSDGLPWDDRRFPSRNCNEDTALDVAREVASGATVRDSIRIPLGAIQGDFKVNVWFFDVGGLLLDEQPFSSGVFDVFPSA